MLMRENTRIKKYCSGIFIHRVCTGSRLNPCHLSPPAELAKQMRKKRWKSGGGPSFQQHLATVDGFRKEKKGLMTQKPQDK